MFRSILVATDFSPGGSHAVEVASKWAEAGSATLDVVHVVSPLITAAVPGTELLEELHAAIQNDAEGKIDDVVARLRPRVRATGHVVKGFAQRAIVQAARELKCDLIVVGSSGAGAIDRTLLGSVADRVLRASDRPVLVVPSDTAVALPRVLVAPTDLSPPSEQAVDRALELAMDFAATVEVVHAYEIPLFVGRDSPLVRDLSRTLREGVRSLHDLGARANLHVVEGPPAKTIVDVAASTHADLIVMAGSGRGPISSLFLGGVTDRVVRTSHRSVLVLRAAAPSPR
jgi:nucleotide-binding universal stress UspA family protein